MDLKRCYNYMEYYRPSIFEYSIAWKNGNFQYPVNRVLLRVPAYVYAGYIRCRPVVLPKELIKTVQRIAKNPIIIFVYDTSIENALITTKGVIYNSGALKLAVYPAIDMNYSR